MMFDLKGVKPMCDVSIDLAILDGEYYGNDRNDRGTMISLWVMRCN